MIIPRLLTAQIRQAITPGKVLVLCGPRQVGKSTLVTRLLPDVPLQYRFTNADELAYRKTLAGQSRQTLTDLLSDAQLLVIDQVQRVPNT